MSWRAGHGTGKGSPRIETVADELPFAKGSDTDRSDRGPDGRFLAGNRSAQAARIRPGVRGGIDKADPAYRPFRNWARRYASHRRAELARLHGGEISAGVGAIIESAATTLGAARFFQVQGEESLNPDFLKRAADLSALARQHELAGFELAAREATAKPKTSKTKALIESLRGDGD